MARPLRIEFSGAFYHVMSRGNEKKAIYKSRRDRTKFLGYLESASTRYGAVIHSYCLMHNHYHLLMETPDGNLSQIMRHINGAYTSYFNTKHGRVGHLFQGRYRAILVDADAYCLTLSRYIHMNPVNECLSQNPIEYEWSSYRSYLSEKSPLPWLQTRFLLSLVGDGVGVRETYQKYVEQGDDMHLDLYAKISTSTAILGRQEFVEDIVEGHLSGLLISRDLPASRELRNRPEIQKIVDTVAKLLNEDHRLTRKMCIYICHHFSGCSLKEIGNYFGVGESAISESSNRFALTLYQDQLLAETVAGLLAELKM